MLHTVNVYEHFQFQACFNPFSSKMGQSLYSTGLHVNLFIQAISFSLNSWFLFAQFPLSFSSSPHSLSLSPPLFLFLSPLSLSFRIPCRLQRFQQTLSTPEQTTVKKFVCPKKCFNKTVMDVTFQTAWIRIRLNFNVSHIKGTVSREFFLN